MGYEDRAIRVAGETDASSANDERIPAGREVREFEEEGNPREKTVAEWCARRKRSRERDERGEKLDELRVASVPVTSGAILQTLASPALASFAAAALLGFPTTGSKCEGRVNVARGWPTSEPPRVIRSRVDDVRVAPGESNPGFVDDRKG
ncbi:hypothetical protein KM043_006412 [Ampulex compressa]|nr:hypothetical protein KM043_006412 [Ampulex compressa]